MEISVKSKLKELLSHGVIFGLTSSLQNILGFILLPILTTYFTTANFGIYSIILLIAALASSLFYFGASTALGRFYYDEDTEFYKKQITSAALLVTAIGALSLITIAVLGGRYLSSVLFHTTSYALHITLSLTGAAFTFLLNTMTLVLRYEKKSVIFMIVTLTGVIINFFITYILLTRYHFQLLAPIYGSVISSAGSFLFLLLLYLKKLTLNIKKSHAKQILSFGIQASLTGLLYYLLDWVDRLIIKDLLPMSDVGIYSLGYRLGSVMNVLLILPFSLIWGPIRMEYSKNENNKTFVSKVISYFSIFGISLVFIAILFGTDIMRLFFHNGEYYAAAKVYPLIMLSIFLFGFQNILDFGMYLHKKVHFYIIISAVGLAINILLNYWLIPKFGYIAAAYVTLLTYLITTLMLYFISSIYYKLIVEWTRIYGALLFLIVVYFLLNYSDLTTSHPVIVKGCICIIALLALFKFWLQKSEVDSLKKMLHLK